MRILVDCDGVLADFVGRFLERVNARLGTMHRREDVTEYNISRALGWTPEQEHQAYSVVEPGFCTGLDVLPGAREGVEALQRFGEIYVVTSPWLSCSTWEHERRQWLERHFGIPALRVISTEAKYVVSGDVLIDDKVEHLDAWAHDQRCGWPLLWLTPHNARALCRWPRVATWDGLVELIQERAEGRWNKGRARR